ncbi:MAG: AAA family ATPase [Candidatus Thorarchaeota archaeon]
MTRQDESGAKTQTNVRGSTKKNSKGHGAEVPGATRLVLREVGYPFRLRGDPKPGGLEVDSIELFTEYAREQWIGSIVRTGIYLFDRYVMPDFAFQVMEVEPPEAVITRHTDIVLQTTGPDLTQTLSRKLCFDDIIGHESVKQKCQLILRYLEDPKKFGEWAPRAILFYGSPGTGKSMTARALASHANARIILTKASDMIGVHVGDGGRRISALFEDARRLAPCVVFLDELDAIGLSRSFQSIRGDVSEVVTALLSEMDRTGEESGVVVIGATNAPALIDPALRSRFDAVFEFKLPTIDERARILELYAKRLPIPIDIDIRRVAAMTEGLSGRDLRDRVIKESLHIAIAEKKDRISSETVESVLRNLRGNNDLSYVI